MCFSPGASLLQKGLLPRYCSSSWSHAQLRLPPGAGGGGGAGGAGGGGGGGSGGGNGGGDGSQGAAASASAASASAASAAAAPRSVVAFGAAPHTLLVAVANGTFHTCVASFAPSFAPASMLHRFLISRFCVFCAHHIRCTFDPLNGGEVASEFVRFLDAEGDAEADAEAAAERGGGALGGGGGGTA